MERLENLSDEVTEGRSSVRVDEERVGDKEGTALLGGSPRERCLCVPMYVIVYNYVCQRQSSNLEKLNSAWVSSSVLSWRACITIRTTSNEQKLSAAKHRARKGFLEPAGQKYRVYIVMVPLLES